LQRALAALVADGQSSGWLMSKNSSTPSCAFLTLGASVSTTMLARR
jgi:hypothetical protein